MTPNVVLRQKKLSAFNRALQLRLLFALATLSLLLFVPAWTIAKDKWVRIESNNFILIGNANEKDIKKVALKLEQYRQTLALLMPRAKFDTYTPTYVYVFDSDKDFDPFKPLYKGKTKKNVGGYFLSGPDAKYIALSNEYKGRDVYDIIFHEYFHFVMDNNLPDAPAWLNEGLAEYYSTFEMNDDGKTAKLGSPIGRHILTLREKPLLPLEKLFAVDHKSPDYNESSKAGIFYAQSWTLVHYLLLGDNSKRQNQFWKFVSNLKSIPSIEENFRQSFQADYKQIEKELREYVSRFLFPIINIVFKEQMVTDKTLQAAALSDAEADQALGELSLWMGHFEDAEKRLTNAVKLDQKYVPAHLSLAMLRWRQRQPAEAKKIYEQALALDQNNFLAQYYMGQFLAAEEDAEGALKAFQTSISLKPNIPRSHASLARLYESMGKEAEAIAAYDNAIKLNQQNSGFYRSQSFILLRAGKNNRAAARAMAFLSLKGWLDEASPYVALTAYFGYRRENFANANTVLSESLKRFKSGEWPYPVFRYLNREIKAEELLAQATDNDKMTEARAYIGMDLVTESKYTEALPHLLWVRDNGNRRFIEYPLALSEIRRIEEKLNGPTK